MAILDEFVVWSDLIKPEIEHVGKILSEPMSDEPSELIQAMTTAEVWGYRCGALLAQAESWLDRSKFNLMPERKEGKLEADRKAELDFSVSPIRLVRDTLRTLCESIETRISLGQSILSFHKIQIERRVMEPQSKRVA